MALPHRLAQPLAADHAAQQVGSGALSSSERGRARRQRAITQPSDSMVSQRAPVRITPSESER